VVVAAGAGDDAPELAVEDLLLADEEGPIEAERIADMEAGAAFLRRFDHTVGVFEGERDRLFDEDRLAEFQSLDRWRRMLGLAGRDKDGADAIVADDLAVVAGDKIGLDLCPKLLGA
jgi:hypothetical protein